MKFIILIILLALLMFGALVFFLKLDKTRSQLIQSGEVFRQMQEIISQLQSGKEKAEKDYEKLQADIVSYIALNAKLQDEKDNLQKSLEDKDKIIESKEVELEKAKEAGEALEEIKNKFSKIQNGRQGFIREKEELKNKINSLENALLKERALYSYNLAVAYTQAKFYDEAIEAYEKSLKFNPNNPEAHYNLGLLYDNLKNDIEKAALHYSKYLQLKPSADDKTEVQALINRKPDLKWPE